jgi:drug/metabolite transporter (DMT)-like permease
MNLTVTVLALSAAACLGFALVLTQMGLQQVSPLRGACISVPCSALAYLALAPFLLDASAITLRGAAIFAFCGCLFPAAVTLLTFEANRRVGPAITGAFGNLTPLIAALLAVILLGEVPGLGVLTGMAIILAGVLLIMGAPRTIPQRAFGGAIGLLLLGAFIRGLVQPLVKTGLTDWPNPFAASLIAYVMSAGVIIMAGFMREGRAVLHPPAASLHLFIPVGLLNGLSVLLIYAALERGSVAVVASLVACYPLATLVLSRSLLGAGGLNRRTVAGVIVTVLGVAVLLRG